jgi:hypothetical protein
MWSLHTQYTDYEPHVGYNVPSPLCKFWKYVLVGFPPVMGSSPNPSFQVIGLRPIVDFVADGQL